MVDLKKLADQSTQGSLDIDTFPPDTHTDADEIEALFDAAQQASPSEFLDSLYDWWETKGFLTELQFNKLQEIAERS